MTIWSTQLTTLESRAAEHDRYALDLISHVADPFRHLSTRLEEIRKRHTDYAIKLEKERDAGYGDLKRMKGSYDNVCQEVENRRKKADSSFDYSKQKAQNALQQHTSNMHNVKVRGVPEHEMPADPGQNSYLIHINVTNKQKAKYYHEYLPELLDVGLSHLSSSVHG